MQVKDFLPKVRATAKTYHNLTQDIIVYYQKRYEYLKKHKEKQVGDLAAETANNWLTAKTTDWEKKYKAMQALSVGIKH